MIAVVDTGGANLASITNALERLEAVATLTKDPETIRKASHVILPGVGAARASMQLLQKIELNDCLRALTQPTLGICLGMQLLFEASEEGPTSCLGIIPGKVSRFADLPGRTIPHMGWNQLISRSSNPLMRDITEDAYFYFVHSYFAPSGPWVTSECDYQGSFPAMVLWKNFFGVQFHPERSAKAGAQMLRSFVSL